MVLRSTVFKAENGGGRFKVGGRCAVRLLCQVTHWSCRSVCAHSCSSGTGLCPASCLDMSYLSKCNSSVKWYWCSFYFSVEEEQVRIHKGGVDPDPMRRAPDPHRKEAARAGLSRVSGGHTSWSHQPGCEQCQCWLTKQASEARVRIGTGSGL